MMTDPIFNSNEITLIHEFEQGVKDRVNKHGMETGWNIYSIADEYEIDINSYHKEGIFIQAMWLILLDTMKSTFNPEAFKYTELQSFLLAYDGMFDDLPEDEQLNLMNTANWMSILFKIIPAKKNKGLVMQIIPKLVEGWHAKYVTGSGQTKPTANRVHIFEKEGEVEVNHRNNKFKTKKPIKSHRFHKTTEKLPPNTNCNRKLLKRKAENKEDNNNLKQSRSFYQSKEYIPAIIYSDPINSSKYKSYLIRNNQINLQNQMEMQILMETISASEEHEDYSLTDIDMDSLDGLDILNELPMPKLSLSRSYSFLMNNNNNIDNTQNNNSNNKLSLVNPIELKAPLSYSINEDRSISWSAVENSDLSDLFSDDADILDILASYM